MESQTEEAGEKYVGTVTGAKVGEDKGLTDMTETAMMDKDPKAMSHC